MTGRDLAVCAGRPPRSARGLQDAARANLKNSRCKPPSDPKVPDVITEDEFGTTIGRNFVEVDQGRTGPGYVAHK